MNVNALASTALRSTAGAPPASPDTPSAPECFANLLDREKAPAKEPTEQADETSPPNEGAQSAERTAAQRARNARAPARAAERPAAHAPAQGDVQAGVDGAKSKDGAPATEDGPPADPSLLHWLQGLNLPAPPTGGTPQEAAMLHGAAKTQPLDAQEGGDDAALTPPTGTATASRAVGRDRRGATELAAERTPSARESQALRGEAVAQAETARAMESAAPRFQDTLASLRAPSAEAVVASAPAAPTGATDPATQATQTTQAALPVPFDDPQFPRAFGVQVSVLAREGVQRAELQLNPAEMGPVSIQIVMDGTQARIDFGADAAPTRALIEQSLPDLAAAMREAGLTLAGGGVSQHAGGRDAGTGAGAPQRGESDRAGRIDATTPDAVARAPRRTVRAGGVDLYA